MGIMKLFTTQNGRIILSIILGLGLTGLFKKICKDGDESCVVMKGPSLNDVNEKVFKHKDKCFIYEKEVMKCNQGDKIVNME